MRALLKMRAPLTKLCSAMKSRVVFLDANILIDFLQANSHGHELSTNLINFLLNSKRKMVVSPATFAISCYFLNKAYNDSKTAKKIAQEIFSHFTFSEHTKADVAKCLKSDFIDLEDALQYFSALQSNADIIVTQNVHDYFPSKIPVMHPFEFLSIYNS